MTVHIRRLRTKIEDDASRPRHLETVFGSEFRPTNPSQLFVSNAHGGTGSGTVSAFEVGFSGALSSIGSSPFADLQTAPCWVEISHDGQFLFTVNTGSGEISSYAIAPSGSLTLLGSTPFGAAGAGAVDARLSPDGRTLLVNGSKANVVASFSVSGGSLTELSSSPTPLVPGNPNRTGGDTPQSNLRRDLGAAPRQSAAVFNVLLAPVEYAV